MTLEYGTDQRINDVTAVLNEYSGWFMLVLRCLSYPGEADMHGKITLPDSYADWIKDVQLDKLAEKLNELQAELSKEAGAMVQKALESKATPSYKEYNHLITLYEEFTHHVRRVERDILLEDSGMDALTGLRSAAVFKKDISREMDRLARQGKQFCVALVRIDHLDRVKKENDEALVNENLKSVAGMIRRSVRSFDDAYRMENDEFLLALKQADMSGGIKAMERLKKELEEKSLTYKIDGKTVPLSLSSCIAEPVPGDDIDNLLANLDSDLGKGAKDDGAVLEYFEMSPLQRYAKEMQD